MKTLSLNKSTSLLLFGGLALTLLIVEFFIVQTPYLGDSNFLPLAITLDIVIGVPVLFYFLIIRKFQLQLTTLLVVYLISVGLARLILPDAYEGHLFWFEMSLIFTELTIFGVLLFNIRRVIKQFKIERRHQNDFLINLERSFEKVMKKKLAPVVGEIAMVRYAFFWWRIKSEYLPHQYPFTMHRKSGVGVTIGALMLATIAETIAVHLLLANWNYTLAIVLLMLSIYSFVFLIGYLAAIYKRPTLIENNQLLLRIGFVWYAVIDLSNIETIETVRRVDEADKTILNVASSLLILPNILITLKTPQTLTWLYGIKKTTSKIALYMDERDKFIEALKS